MMAQPGYCFCLCGDPPLAPRCPCPTNLDALTREANIMEETTVNGGDTVPEGPAKQQLVQIRLSQKTLESLEYLKKSGITSRTHLISLAIRQAASIMKVLDRNNGATLCAVTENKDGIETKKTYIHSVFE